ncbi:hypothetical protein BZG36_04575 [Bifiguratus adelaidae]|uniref:Uncharacterized protein n=1 Tax=Bifiguratus adelaidae TaxID=1938954 RepID=A0A261XUP8_9FUNG|nr:hypothetical protein BZG36_04575 [Bifiguratus adelaidae]
MSLFSRLHSLAGLESMMKEYEHIEVAPIGRDHVLPLHFVRPWKMNLLAGDKKDSSLFYIAVNCDILVFKKPNPYTLPTEPIQKLRSPFLSAETSATDEEDHAINAITVGFLGAEQVLVAANDNGSVIVWFLDHLDRAPIILTADEAAWGIALHAKRRLLAVSCNSHNVTVFNLSDEPSSHKRRRSSASHSTSSKSSAKSEKEARKDDEPSSNDTQHHKRHRDEAGSTQQDRRILRGHRHNVPNIDFSTCGNYLVSCSIDGSCRVWNVNTGKCILHRDFDNGGNKWGWSTRFIPRHKLKHLSFANVGMDSPFTSNADNNGKPFGTHHISDWMQLSNALRLWSQTGTYNDVLNPTNIVGLEDLFAGQDAEDDDEEEAAEGDEMHETDTDLDDDVEYPESVESSLTHDDNELQDIVQEEEEHEEEDSQAESEAPHVDAANAGTMIFLGHDVSDSEDITQADLWTNSLPSAQATTTHHTHVPNLTPRRESIEETEANTGQPNPERDAEQHTKATSTSPMQKDASKHANGLYIHSHLPQDLILYTNATDLFLLDPLDELTSLYTVKRIVSKRDNRRIRWLEAFDRLNMMEVIPALSLAVIASQKGRVALVRLVRICNDAKTQTMQEEKYVLHTEAWLPWDTIPVAPLLGFFITEHSSISERDHASEEPHDALAPSSTFYHLHLVYYDGTVFTYALRHGIGANPLRIESIVL